MITDEYRRILDNVHEYVDKVFRGKQGVDEAQAKVDQAEQAKKEADKQHAEALRELHSWEAHLGVQQYHLHQAKMALADIVLKKLPVE